MISPALGEGWTGYKPVILLKLLLLCDTDTAAVNINVISLKPCDWIPLATQLAFPAQEIFAVKITRRQHEPSMFQLQSAGTPEGDFGYEKLIHWFKTFSLESE